MPASRGREKNPNGGCSGLKFIICLGNPGSQYRDTPHNIGYDVAEILSDGSEFTKKKSLYLVARRKKDGISIIKPLTFMNLSGKAVLSIVSTKMGNSGIRPSEMLVVCDDFALPMGRIRCRMRGSDGGHKGLRSIISDIGENFPRLKIGVGPVSEHEDPADFVLRPFAGELLRKKNLVVRAAANIIEEFISSKEIRAATWDFSKEIESADCYKMKN